mmetsp:Transcript_12737/g.35828  ORF Transcript_12737/g.35828 Transcript_12737/m.35828 type:complete len:580 (-) Transcript_12737:253-1992(-)|eukprot:CAMPEP_0117659616 /NCGR_PEP_ID=MMETSP0804-20121206/6527_1 /TAXON_ID=1074897 /ORGANISM="Tetraselmis astigmatica, Strain CCMP880" /LENGTH=579 /DNA_ID=CAMNT_0005466285 /DNA_START=109 /DNA_END=1848 /DNA_ORIENTATION=-
MAGMRVHPGGLPAVGTKSHLATTFQGAESPAALLGSPGGDTRHVPRAWGFASVTRTRSRAHKSTISAVENTNTAAVFLLLGNFNSFAAIAIVGFAFLLVCIQISTLLNMAWILGDARVYDLQDYEDAYYLLPPNGDGDMKPDHKHILNQDDRFCYTPQASTNQNLYYMYYTCLHENSMTLWDLFTLMLLSLAMLEKLAEAHEELTIQGSLVVMSMVDQALPWRARVTPVIFMSLRLLQEGLFVAVSISIVAASKGTVQMILNSLAISFMADLDNLAWSLVRDYAPTSVELMVEHARQLVCQTHAGGFLYMEEHSRRRIFFTLFTWAVYLLGTIVYKSQDAYNWLTSRGAPDSNIQAGVFILPMLAMWIGEVPLLVNMAVGGLRQQADSGLNSTMADKWWGVIAGMGLLIAVSITLMSVTIATVEAGAGAQCSWRQDMLLAALEAIPTIATGVTFSVWLKWHHHFPSTVEKAIAGLAVALAVLSVLFAGSAAWLDKEWSGDVSGVVEMVVNRAMGGPGTWTYFKQVCVCGYPGNWLVAHGKNWFQRGCHMIPGLCQDENDPATWFLHRSGACNRTDVATP